MLAAAAMPFSLMPLLSIADSAAAEGYFVSLLLLICYAAVHTLLLYAIQHVVDMSAAAEATLLHGAPYAILLQRAIRHDAAIYAPPLTMLPIAAFSLRCHADAAAQHRCRLMLMLPLMALRLMLLERYALRCHAYDMRAIQWPYAVDGARCYAMSAARVCRLFTPDAVAI